MLQNELFQDAIVYYFQICLSNLCCDVTSNSFIFGMIIFLTDFVIDCPNLSENQQTLNSKSILQPGSCCSVDLSRFCCITYIYNIVYLEISLNWPKKDHFRMRVIPQVHRTRSFMYQSSAHLVKEKKGSSVGVRRRDMMHFSCHIDTESHIQCSVKRQCKLVWSSKYYSAGLDLYSHQQSHYHQGNAKKRCR